MIAFLPVRHWPFFLILLILLPVGLFARQADRFHLVSKAGTASIVYQSGGEKLDSIAAHLLADDIQRVTGKRPPVVTRLAGAGRCVVVIGRVGAPLISQVMGVHGQWLTSLSGGWERYGVRVVNRPMPEIDQALVIAGSDVRGMAYGVFALSEQIGVSPWYWWANAPVRRKATLSIHQAPYLSPTPSVKYRGIFINDEDWGLQPWAAKTFERETGDIGPKTYAKVFELLLRLKANLIWPAMHPSTKAFYHYPGNPAMAEAYAIVVGTSHAEPMMRNNVSEWEESSMGPFNYITNRNRVYQYWEERVRQTGQQSVIYSMGMRGVHDSGMEGIKDPAAAVPLLEQIFQDQRGLLAKYRQMDTARIPQVFTAYKEVLDIYDKGLRLPDDITLVWPDDNYGYIQRLSNETEQKRKGGAGVYYHASYWGRPHDYLWLGTAHPGLMREEMMKAYDHGARQLWVLNVGDIKPLEYNTQLFLDMAYDASAFKDGLSLYGHLNRWLAQQVDRGTASALSSIMWQYYQMAFERRPEFMGWSQTEPTTKTRLTGYNHFSYRDEAQRRIDGYSRLEQTVRALRGQLSTDSRAAFYQLVYYPVMGASWLNKKFLYRDKAWIYHQQGRLVANDYARLSRAMQDSIERETAFYNEQLAGGKWKHIMSMQPRNLPVFLPPVLPAGNPAVQRDWAVAVEGQDTNTVHNAAPALPVFTAGLEEQRFIDVFLGDTMAVEWTAKTSADWIRLSATRGRLTQGYPNNSIRLWVSIDVAKAPAGTVSSGYIVFQANDRQERVLVSAKRPGIAGWSAYKGFVEQNKLVSIKAAGSSLLTTGIGSSWRRVANLGHSGASVEANVERRAYVALTDSLPATGAATIAYTFFSLSQEPPVARIYTLPTHTLHNSVSMRYGVRLDDGAVQVVDTRTLGRSEEWKQNVLSNTTVRQIAWPSLLPGKHRLTIYAIDPGVILDRILIRFGNAAPAYGVVPETIKR
ncbi:glycosyl hydrolase 115 family protein [Paraflavitalea pollutisoli]|uniref:glycosyl hydrolase 115 family protein n=1 Tax=Paraflavitalea pollutisoli TaxID=3034143 RepID=UPI0023ECC4D9|nr:glycosyl hydrolase 115 family protein [Paraflavitalea sp. H1-2-19X]